MAKTVLKWKRKPNECSIHRPHAHISTFFWPVQPHHPQSANSSHDSLLCFMTCCIEGQQSVRMKISPGQRGFSSLWFACKCWIWHLHLSVISSGYHFQISSLYWHLCSSILPCVYVYLEHLAVLSCAIVSQNARFDGSEIFPLWFSTHFL